MPVPLAADVAVRIYESAPVAPFSCPQILRVGLSLFLQSSALLSAGLAAGFVLQKQGASALLRSAVYRLTLLLMFFVLLFTAGTAGRERQSVVRVALPGVYERRSEERSLPGATPAAGQKRALVTRTRLVGGVYGAGLLLWVAVAMWQGLRLRRGWQSVERERQTGFSPEANTPAAQEVARVCRLQNVPLPQIIVSPLLDAPFVAGWRKPTLFLPEEAAREDLSQEERAALSRMLAHEIAHLRRRDCLWSFAGYALCAVLWFQPLLKSLCRRMEQTADEVCDEAALHGERCGRAFAEQLLRLAEARAASPDTASRAPGPASAGARSALGRRIEHLLRLAQEPKAARAPVELLSPAVHAGLWAGAAALFLFSVQSISAVVPAAPDKPAALCGPGARRFFFVQRVAWTPLAKIRLSAATSGRGNVSVYRHWFTKGATPPEANKEA